MYSDVEQILLDLLPKDVIGDTLEAHIAKFLDTDEFTDRVQKKLLTSSSFMASIATYVHRKTNTAIADRNIVFTKTSKERNSCTHGSIWRYY